MKRLPMAGWVFIVGVLVSVGQILMLGPLLPTRVASHFGFSGVADGFLAREAFLAIQWGITAFLVAVFVGLPALMRISPVDAVNLPNKGFWLAPERREATIAYVADRLFAFGSATLALMAGVMQLVYEANLRGSAKIGGLAGVYLAVYLLYTVIWSVTLTRRFSPLPP